MSITLIIAFIILGLLLILVEFLLTPGLSIAGIGALIFFGIAVYGAFNNHEPIVGSVVLIGLLILIPGVIWLVTRQQVTKNIELSTTIQEQVVTVDGIQVGDEGKTIGRLAPSGNVRFNKKIYEARSIHGFIDPNCVVEAIKIENNTIIVKQKL